MDKGQMRTFGNLIPYISAFEVPDSSKLSGWSPCLKVFSVLNEKPASDSLSFPITKRFLPEFLILQFYFKTQKKLLKFARNWVFKGFGQFLVACKAKLIEVTLNIVQQNGFVENKWRLKAERTMWKKPLFRNLFQKKWSITDLFVNLVFQKPKLSKPPLAGPIPKGPYP